MHIKNRNIIKTPFSCTHQRGVFVVFVAGASACNWQMNSNNNNNKNENNNNKIDNKE